MYLTEIPGLINKVRRDKVPFNCKPIGNCETLCPFIEHISPGSYDEIAISVVYTE